MLTSKRSPILRPICWMVALLAAVFAGPAWGQVVPSATLRRHSLSVGGEYANVRASYPYSSVQRLWEMGGFADYSLARNINIEADARHLLTNGFYSETQDNYLAGPQYTIGKLDRLQPYAHFLVGLGVLRYPSQVGSGVFLALAPSAGASFRCSPRISVRGGYEYQYWPNSSNIANKHGRDLTPNGVHVGVVVKLF